MLTKYKDVRPQKGVKNPLKNVFTFAAHSKIFRVGAPDVDVFFSGRIILKRIENKESSRGIRGDASPEIFENLRRPTAVAILVLFEQFLGKFFCP